MSFRFNTKEKIQSLEKIGYTVNEVEYLYEREFSGFFKESFPVKYFSCFYNGECMDGLTGQERSGTKVLDWVFEQELNKRVLKLIFQ